MKHKSKIALISFTIFLLTLFVSQNIVAMDLNNVDDSGIIVSNIYCEKGILSIVVENNGDEAIDEYADGGLNIWIDGELKWTYSWSTWTCQDFRLPGEYCIIQPQVLEDGEHTIEACLVINDEAGNSEDVDCMEKRIICGENPGNDPQDPDTPLEGDCVTAEDYFSVETFNLPKVLLGDITITAGKLSGGTDVELDVTDCSGDNALDISIPWSESSGAQPASILFSQFLCPQGYPEVVEVTLKHGNYAILSAFNASGAMADTKSAANNSTVQTITLTSSDGIQRIDFDGSEICILKICWECEPGHIDDPPVIFPCPQEVIDEAYQKGYQAGLAAAAANADNNADNNADDISEDNGMCAIYDYFKGTLDMPCVELKGFGESTYWIEFQMYGPEDIYDPEKMNFYIKVAGQN